jgi:UDP-glucose 4-epimerase
MRASSAFVFASSAAPVGEVEPPVHEDKAPRPVSPYGASKLAGEGYCSAYARSFGLETVALRFGNVYDPIRPQEQRGRCLHRTRPGRRTARDLMVMAARAGDFIHVDDSGAGDRQGGQRAGHRRRDLSLRPRTRPRSPSWRRRSSRFWHATAWAGCSCADTPPRAGDVRRNLPTPESGRAAWLARRGVLGRGLAGVVRWFLVLPVEV